MEPVPPPAPGGPAVPKLSTTVLLAIAGIGAVVLASIFGYILFIATLRLDERLWWIGFCSILFALAFFLLYAATHDRKIAQLGRASCREGREVSQSERSCSTAPA